MQFARIGLVRVQASGSLDLRPTAAKVSCQAPALSASATLHTRPPSPHAMKQALTQVPNHKLTIHMA